MGFDTRSFGRDLSVHAVTTDLSLSDLATCDSDTVLLMLLHNRLCIRFVYHALSGVQLRSLDNLDVTPLAEVGEGVIIVGRVLRVITSFEAGEELAGEEDASQYILS